MSEKKALRAQIKAQKAEIRALYERLDVARLQAELDELRYRAERLRQEVTEANGAAPAHHRTGETLGDLLRSKGIKVEPATAPECKLGQEGYWSCEDCNCERCREATNVVPFRASGV